MKKGFTTLLVLISAVVFAQQPRQDFFSNSRDFFSKYVSKGRVKYEAVKKDTVLLNTLITQIGTFNWYIAGKNSRKAFYLNAYNILVIKAVADNYPSKSTSDIPGFFDKKIHVFAGEILTLDEIEKIKIRNEYDDPRIHFWLNHAVLGDPELNNNGMMIYNVNDLLDSQTKAVLNNDNFIGLDEEHKEVMLPMLFKINESDFTHGGKSILDYINYYRKKKINNDFHISYYPGNQTLNDWKAKTISISEQKAQLPIQSEDTLIEPAISNAEPIAEKIHQKDSTVGNNLLPKMYDDVLSQGSFMLDSGFQIRAMGILNTQHAAYNNDLTRINNGYRTSYFNLAIQGWNRISKRVNYGVQLNFRSLAISDFNSSPYGVLSFSNNTSSKFYFRDISNSIKYLFHEGRWRVTGITTILVPGSKSNFVKYGSDSLFDIGQTQWINQLFVVRSFSKYFTLNTELNSTQRFNASNSANKFIVRGALLPEFNYWVSQSIRFYAFCELNSQLHQSFFSTFYFREGAGLSILSGKTSQFDFQYYYYALGKKSVASNSIMVGGRFNF